MIPDETPDVVMSVHFEDGSSGRFTPCDEVVLRQAVSRWIGEGADSLIDLTGLGGQFFRVKASFVTAWEVSTAEERLRHARHVRALDAAVSDDGWQGAT